MLEPINFLFVGVGGQGILTASDIAAEVGLEAGYDAKKSEVHGFSQRGGVVESHVRWACHVASPLAEMGTVDFLVATELMEAVRWLQWVRRTGTVIASTQRITPMSVSAGDAAYPADDKLLTTIRRWTDNVTTIESLPVAERLGNTRLANTVLLGALSVRLGVSPETWVKVIEARVPPKTRNINCSAFTEGRRAAEAA
jgi:indolepyruvate ferredoxin oxidoreductase beta subunit